MDKTAKNNSVKAKDSKKKKPSPQNRIWEKERRERLNRTFETLCKLLPEYEPSTTFSKIDILQKSIKFIENLQNKINDITTGKETNFKKHLNDLEERLKNLLSRNEDLCELLKKAKINIPPSKYIVITEKDDPANENDSNNKKVEIKTPEKTKTVKKIKETEEQKEPPKSVIPTTSVITNPSTALTQSVVLIPSSVLIVSSDGISDKVKCKKKGRVCKNQLEIKSIDIIPGQIKNGKIPIRPLKRPMESGTCKKPRKKRKIKDEVHKSSVMPEEKLKDKPTKIEHKIETDAAKKIEEIDNNKENIGSKTEERIEKIELKSISLNQTELSSDILEVLQVPNTAESSIMSPTAAYLMTFPLVLAGGGKNSGNNEDSISDGEETEKKNEEPSNTVLNDSNLLDNFSSFFTSNSMYTDANVVPNYSTNYQSIDNIIDGKAKSTKALPEFTFTLTSTVQTPTTSVISTFDYHNLPTRSSEINTKPSLLPDFTFSLTSSTMTPPKTVQSHYTNSTNFTSTITTPSNDSKKYYNTNSSSNFASGSNCTYSTFPNPNYEQPATNFTFSLTSTTKTMPKYTSSHNKISCLKTEDEILKTPTKHKTPSKNKYDVNWMASQDCKINNNTSDFPMLPPIDFATPTSTFYPNLDITRKSDIFFAHPGEENWSPNKITNFLSEPIPTAPQYLPTTLPNLKGDLSLGTNTLASVRAPSNISNMSNRLQKKNLNNESNFLSVRQLVDQKNDKHQPKSFNNNYSAESLIATSTSNNPKKDNFYNYAPAMDTASSSLTFNFDYNNYNNNFNCNSQSYTSSLIDCSYSNVGSQQNYYSNSPIKTQNHQYYQHDNIAPYYLPEKKYPQNYTSHNQNKSKSKPYKSTNNNYQPPPPPPPPPPLPTATSTANSSSYFPSIISQVEPDYSSYHSFNYTPNISKTNQCHTTNSNSGPATGNTLTNFNLMSICPEISNEKSGGRYNSNNTNNIITSW